MQPTFTSLQYLILQWAEDKGIFDHSTPERQLSKTYSEVTEIHDALVNDDKHIDDDKDAIGDTVVTLVIQAHMWDLSGVGCYCDAVNSFTADNYSFVNDKHKLFNTILHRMEDLHEAILSNNVQSVSMNIGLLLHLLKHYCTYFDFSFVDAIDHAYHIISKRTGSMIDGLFVKDTAPEGAKIEDHRE